MNWKSGKGFIFLCERLTRFATILLLIFCFSVFGKTVEAQDWREEVQFLRRGNPVPVSGFFLTEQGWEWLSSDVERYRLASVELEEAREQMLELEGRVQQLQERVVVLREEADNLLLWNAETFQRYEAELSALEFKKKRNFWLGAGFGFAAGLTPFLFILLLKN